MGEAVFVHETAIVIGRVSLGSRSSVWPTAVIRGDVEHIVVGDETNVQDGAVIHADPGRPCTVGHRVTIGHRATVHGCTIGDEVLVGIGATILNGAVIGDQCIVGAHALVPEGMEIPAGVLVIGIPATVRRDLTDEERAGLAAQAARYVANAARHAAEARDITM
ncbi:MAG: gamma carbonic anhydrase family protein [Thermoleophilia bacterium]|nr:gamma carbonic anhydrase family protein [Thermoleophilia bacterium]